MPEDEQIQTPVFSKKKKVLWATIATIIIGAIGSGVWDLLAKPGLSSFGRIILNIVTLGSERARDSAYSSAVLDPTPIAPLLIILILSFIPLVIASFVALVEFIFRKIERGLKQAPVIPAKQSSDKEKEDAARSRLVERRQRLGKLRRKLSVGLIVYLLIVFGIAQVGFLILNQAVLIRRVFYANMNICAPYMSEFEEKRFRARFSSVKTKADYQAIDHELRELAAKNGASLLDYNLW